MSSRRVYFSPQAIEATSAGRQLDAIRLLRADNGLGLREAKEAVEAYASGHRDVVSHDPSAGRYPEPGRAESARIDQLMREGREVDAVRELRKATGMGLKDAADWVQARRDLGISAATPGSLASASRIDPRAGPTVAHARGGRAWLIPLVVVLLGALAWWFVGQPA